MKNYLVTKLNIPTLASIVLLCLPLCSCDDDLSWEEQQEKQMTELKEAYAETFKSIFGEIPADQSWDFSSSANLPDFESNTKSTTRATRALWDDLAPKTVAANPEEVAGDNDYYYVPSDVTSWINTNLVEGANNTTKTSGESVYFEVPEEPFTIYPVYQGRSLIWDLYIGIEDSNGTKTERKFWQKSQNIHSVNSSNQFHALYAYDPAPTNEQWNWIEWANGYRGKVSDYHYQTLYNQQFILGISSPNPNDVNTNNVGNQTTTIGADKVATKGYTFDLSAYKGMKMYFYIKVTGRNYVYQNASLGAVQSSLTNQMKFLPATVNNNAGFDSKYKLTFIGIEDADIKKGNGDFYINKDGQRYLKTGTDMPYYTNESNPNDKLYNPAVADYDYNDLVLLMVTEKPVIKEYKDEPETICKRYMVEDLGNTDDLDFNDIVIDVTTSRIKHTEWTVSNGITLDPTVTYTDEVQTATIRALGGTLDFEFMIAGQKVFRKSESNLTVGTMYNTMHGNIDYNKVLVPTFNVSGWRPSQNNVSFKVYTKAGSAGGTSNGVDEKPTSYMITFPKIGEIPYILAFDPTKEWRNERHPFCLDWLNGTEPGDWEWPEPHEPGLYQKDWSSAN